MSALEILYHFYPQDSPLRRLLVLHSTQVRDKALSIAGHPALANLDINLQIVNDGALLHDIGIGRCNAPDIHCTGTERYLLHGTIGARMLREYGEAEGLDLEALARICERHTGAGLTADDVRALDLPLPPVDLLPVTLEEKLVCLADKFYSKSSPEREKTLDEVRRSMAKFGAGAQLRFEELCETFGLK